MVIFILVDQHDKWEWDDLLSWGLPTQLLPILRPLPPTDLPLTTGELSGPEPGAWAGWVEVGHPVAHGKLVSLDLGLLVSADEVLDRD